MNSTNSIQYPKFIIIAVNLLTLTMMLFLTELLLTRFLPYSITIHGHLYCENAEKYGWGFQPYELIRLCNPDTGEIFTSLSNGHGFRDKDRYYDNPKNSFRILVIGDSNTFGAVVPADKTYTRILENRLHSEGLNVEIINMAYGGWATDQQFEALKREGILYEPDVVILQFTTNDLKDNLYYRDLAAKGEKPFYYSIGQDGMLKRLINPYWEDHQSERKTILKTAVRKSQILQRLYGLYLSYRLQKFVLSIQHLVDQKKIAHLKLVFPEIQSGFLAELANFQEISYENLTVIVDKFNLNAQQDTISLILENRWFNKDWTPDLYFFPQPDENSPEWKLFFALLKGIQEVAEQNGADLAIFSNNEIGQYQWERSWHRISPDSISRQNFLAPSRTIQDFATQHGIDFISNLHRHDRAKTDPHPNIDGNEAMAKNVYEFLKEKYYGEMVAR